MNSKKAKALRREIKYNSNTDSDRQYVMVPSQKPRRKKASIKKRYPGSALEKRGKSHHVTLELNPQCRRFLYQEMKKELTA